MWERRLYVGAALAATKLDLHASRRTLADVRKNKNKAMDISPGTQLLRKGRVSSPGQVYLVTTIVKDRTPVFRDWGAAQIACRVATAGMSDSRFIAWVLMPDHFHGLLLVGEEASLSDSMRLFKGRVSVEVNRLQRRGGPLWQSTFHDHAMRREEHLENMARYIVENPVRAGLVSRIGDYPFWNVEWEWEM